MKIISYISVLLYVVIVSCNDGGQEDESTYEQDLQRLEQMFNEIESLAGSVPCEDASIWNITAYGSKACGGPIGYIAYPNSIDTETFLSLIEEHKIAQSNFNVKWGIVSDCAIIPPPSQVICEDGEPIFVY